MEHGEEGALSAEAVKEEREEGVDDKSLIDVTEGINVKGSGEGNEGNDT